MTAPALILLAHGSAQIEANGALHELRMRMQQSRPEINVGLAFLDKCPPSGPAVVAAMAGRGVNEIVFVPVDVSRAVEQDDQAAQMIERVRAAHPELAVTLARPLGPATDLLNVLDERLREALRQSQTVELDALVLSAPAAGDTRGNALIARRARQWSAHHKLPCVVAFNDGPTANVAHAVATLRAQGRRHIAVGSFFVSGDENFQIMRELASAAGVVAVSEPMGSHDFVLDLVMARYVFAAMELLDVESLVEAGQSPAVEDDHAM